MNGREKTAAAFSNEGTPEFPVVVPYEALYTRDLWPQLTSHPWWYRHAPDLDRQLAWRRDVVGAVGQDWVAVTPGFSREQRAQYLIAIRPGGVYLVNGIAGRESLLPEPRVGGDVVQRRPAQLPTTAEDVDERIAEVAAAPVDDLATDGRADLSEQIRSEFSDLCPVLYQVEAPLWHTYSQWGFEGMMTLIADRPDLVRHACEGLLAEAVAQVRQAAQLGAQVVWVEDCLTDMIHPRDYAALNVPYLQALLEEVRSQGMKSVHYYCGDPAGKWDLILSSGADALALEEGKKGFRIDIEDVAERIDGRCVLLGNLDAVAALEGGSEEALRAEIARQMRAGRRNGSRFIMSIGSPVTPGTSIERLRLYCDLGRDMGAG